MTDIVSTTLTSNYLVNIDHNVDITVLYDIESTSCRHWIPLKSLFTSVKKRSNCDTARVINKLIQIYRWICTTQASVSSIFWLIHAYVICYFGATFIPVVCFIVVIKEMFTFLKWLYNKHFTIWLKKIFRIFTKS